MKQGIHPEFKQVTVHCACGNTFETMSAVDDIHVDICSVCHPFYTGKQRLVDTAGRVDRFKKKYGDTSTQARKEAEEAESEAAEEAAAEAEEAAAAADAGAPEAVDAESEADEAEEADEPEADEPEAEADDAEEAEEETAEAEAAKAE